MIDDIDGAVKIPTYVTINQVIVDKNELAAKYTFVANDEHGKARAVLRWSEDDQLWYLELQKLHSPFENEQ